MITERGRALARPRISNLRVPNVSEIDMGALRRGRLARLQAEMKRYDLPVCLFYRTANIRYATGVDVMGVWTAGTFARYCLVPAEGAPTRIEAYVLKDGACVYDFAYVAPPASFDAWRADFRRFVESFVKERAD